MKWLKDDVNQLFLMYVLWIPYIAFLVYWMMTVMILFNK